ncbi:hypothetical protein PLICRDRAFT_164325 [Plicaturopsis crispa FD-325 SS-3]|nr:hypothetical protein PLICRDRAFT_164325 [Plicaturopsis crispa FD-325 SS-3]
MAKRRAAAASDNGDSSDATPASKRARTQDSDDEGDNPAPSGREARGKGKRRARRNHEDEDDEDEEVGAAPVDNEEEKQFEETHEERIRAAIEAKRKVHGGVAEMGIIESIEMHQFMCHKYLTFTFGPQINFIIGHNGSGKSAVLSAITVALGGKANSTGRGNGLKSFIREGQGVSEVTISLKNQGDEAFKPKEYGKSIVITRRFTKEGSSSWKIKSREGKVISTKKDELAAICDHMNIQVDNPMNVLTQDAARQFLSASAPTDKYKFFLRGTQLSQLSEEYDTCLENITQTAKVLSQKKEAIPDLRHAFREATTRFEEASKAREQRHRADELKKELAWAHVATKQLEMEKKIEEVAKAERRLPKIRESLEQAEAEFQAASEAVERFEQEHHDLGDVEDLIAAKRDVQEKMRGNKNKINEFRNDENLMNQSLKGCNQQIDDYKERIAEESRRMEKHTQGKRDEMNRKLAAARDHVLVAEAEHHNILQQKREKIAELEAAKAQGQPAEMQKQEAQQRITACDGQIARCHEQERNNLAPFGKGIRNVIAQIAQMRWQGEVPVGPLGMHVKMRDQSWADLMRVQIGGLMSAFAITDTRDKQQLKNLLNSSGNGNASIIIFARDLFDFSHGEPPSHYPTMLRALEIDDPYVLRVLINQARIERTFMARTRGEADELLSTVPGGGTAITTDLFKVVRFSEGGGSSTTVSGLRRDDPRHMLFHDKNVANQLQQWQDQKAAAEAQYQTAVEAINRARTVHSEASRALNALNIQDKQAYDRVRSAKAAHSALQEEANEELPVGIAALQSALQEAEEEKASILEQFKALQEQKAEVNAAQQPMLVQLNEYKAQIDAFEEKRVAVMTKIEEAVGKRLLAQSSKAHYESKLKEEEKKVQEVQEIAQTLQTEFENWTKRAEEYCERVPNPRKVDVVQRNLDSVTAALREREKRHGATVEEMTIEVNRARANLNSAEKDLKNMTTLNKALKSSLVVRLAKWQEFRRHIALRCKLVFQYHLSNRGYYGKVLFDHMAGTLQLKVQTDDQTASQGRDKDPRSLSGGEKSFSTICLLLSLWESIGCPLRCLDEFDVFMDAVNRRISMRMMIDTANASDKKQYILITPQDMNNVQIGTTVRVHRMTDPERGQGTLAFS